MRAPSSPHYLSFLFFFLSSTLSTTNQLVFQIKTMEYSLDEFDQVKFFLLGKSGLPQLDIILFLNETFLKSVIPSTLYTVPGFLYFP